jgi:hypothetical protein
LADEPKISGCQPFRHDHLSVVESRRIQKPLLGEGFAGAGLEVSLQPSRDSFVHYRHIGLQDSGNVLFGRKDISALMGIETPTEIVCRSHVNIAVRQFEEIDVPHRPQSPCAPDGASGDTLRPIAPRVACHP